MYVNTEDDMQKTDFIRARVEPTLKHDAEAIFKQIGLKPTDAITLFYKQVKAKGGLPFSVKTPNSTTKKAIKSSSLKRNKKSFKSVSELFKDLDK